ncbi:Nem1-Spo7 phosphatase catalytic subunit NEM1, partial [Ascoidea rubescens DSM 1968]
KKTLILDLDETLIHSLSKSSRLSITSSAHMVEVKLNNNNIPTLYYVYKRPYCDEFLNIVSQWFNLIIFTASVKEYADPIINLLEKDKFYFQKRLYRDNCTLNKGINGIGYIKDLKILNTHLSKVIMIDNSPISYSKNLENAIRIEGWINDPTDVELLELIPLLKALRYTNDVRTILGLKNGEQFFQPKRQPI